MRRLLFFAPVLGVLLVAGCGGGGGGTSTPLVYSGSWSGAAGVAGGAGAGGSGSGGSTTPSTVLALSVDSGGHITGSWQDSAATDGAGGSVTGGVTKDGTVSLTLNETGMAPTTARGISNIATNGDWQGSLPVQNGPEAGSSLAFDLVVLQGRIDG